MNKMIMAMGFTASVMLGGSIGLADIPTQPASWTGHALPSGAQILLVMNSDQFQGKWKQFKGDLKKEWGKFTDDDLKQIEGDYDKFQGKLQERYGDRKEEVQRWTDEWFKTHDRVSLTR